MGDRLVTIDMDRKLGAVSLLGGGAASPCNTIRPGPRPTFLPSGNSGILIHLAVWSQQTWAENWGCCAPFCGRPKTVGRPRLRPGSAGGAYSAPRPPSWWDGARSPSPRTSPNPSCGSSGLANPSQLSPTFTCTLRRHSVSCSALVVVEARRAHN